MLLAMFICHDCCSGKCSEMLDLLNPTPTQRKIENELLFGTRDVCCIGTARAGKGVAAVKALVLRSQMHREMGIGSGDYLLIAQSVGAIHRNSKSYFADICRQLGYKFRTRGNPDPHFDVNGARDSLRLAGLTPTPLR